MSVARGGPKGWKALLVSLGAAGHVGGHVGAPSAPPAPGSACEPARGPERGPELVRVAGPRRASKERAAKERAAPRWPDPGRVLRVVRVLAPAHGGDGGVVPVARLTQHARDNARVVLTGADRVLTRPTMDRADRAHCVVGSDGRLVPAGQVGELDSLPRRYPECYMAGGVAPSGVRPVVSFETVCDRTFEIAMDLGLPHLAGVLDESPAWTRAVADAIACGCGTTLAKSVRASAKGGRG